MGKLVIAVLYWVVALQIVSYLCWAFNVFGGLINYPLGGVDSLNSWFNIDVFSVLIGVGGAVGIGLAALLLKQGVYAIYAMLLWGIGCIFKIFTTFVLAIPNTIAAFLPTETNPNPTVFPVNPIVVVIVFVFTFGAWWYLFGLVIQREAN